MKEVVIIGGGLAGLMTAHTLARKKIPCVLIERKEYPFHRVCGEYISEEVTPYLESLQVFPHHFNPPRIKKLQLTSVNGRSAEIALDLGGFGISRYSLDYFLFEQLPKDLVKVRQNTEVVEFHFQNEKFEIKTMADSISADVIVMATGKRSKLDATLQRDFMKSRSPYVGVKYHIQTDHPKDLIALHNFKNGYCGLSNVEDGKSNLCYLTHRDNLKQFKSIREMEEQILFQNPYLKSIYENATFLMEKPEVINEISFATKAPVENHVLMCGDSAGMITPLCGNGMAMAIHASKLVSEAVTDFCTNRINRAEMEHRYEMHWRIQFEKRLWAGRKIQSLFGSVFASNVAVNLARYIRPAANYLVSKTHGQPF